MTAALGGYKPESTEARALGSFSTDKFAYRDQQKNLIQLNNAVGYMSAYMRKMQKGIDSANENFIQQIQGLIKQIFVLFAGGGDTGFDFGDLKYVFQGIGALFGLGNSAFPFNLFDAAWHFFSNYILPVNNFKDAINLLVDGFLATILDIFGEVPIVGQVIQQIAVIFSGIRDAIGPIITALDKLFGSLDGDWFSGVFDVFDPIWDAVTTFFTRFAGPALDFIMPAIEMISKWTEPFVQGIADAANIIAAVIDILSGVFDTTPDGSFPHNFPYAFPDGITGIDINNPVIKFFQNFLSFFNIGSWISGDFNPITAVTKFIQNALKPTNLLAWLDPITGLVPNFQAPQLLVDIIMTIEGAFLGIPIVGQIVKPVFNAINGLLGIGNSAQSTGNTGLSQVAQIWATLNSQSVPNGVQIVEDFNEPSATFLNDRIEQTYVGPGGGTYGTDGTGRAIWRKSGGNMRGCFNRHRTALATDYQQVTLVLPDGLKNSPNGSPDIRMELRCSEDRLTRIECLLKNDYNGNVFAEIGYYLGGTYTKLDAKGNQENKAGDIYEFRAGNGQSGNEPYRFTLLRNGLTILETIDLLHNSARGAAFRYPGWFVNTGARVFFYVTSQMETADLEIFAAADRKVAA